VKRGDDLAKPFNDMFCDDSDSSMSMFAKWMDQDGFICRVDDDLTGSPIDAVHERNLEAFLAGCSTKGCSGVRPKTRT
jgi:hypothetical protein